MSDRERVRRHEPARTAPLRNVSGVFRSGDGSGNGPEPTGAEPSAAGPSRPEPSAAGPSRPEQYNPFAWPADDPVGRAVRAGRDVVESAMRRGFGLGRDPSSSASGAPPWASGAPWPGAWSTGQWV